ncbi:hypothetical protein [Paenarthrobacter nitroguajacolicus]|uniref:hypothetical protein n=1 Tax=Paenarthrobacter nitroguajacolicus TaxID=211146 RepID=UPI00248BE2A0|nr:hypothetical protein [Paenarthrobacter nitroguajacolicus]MDI2034428.1 hypothetical protein [Paenarthrobacter nitroguajacolicus]
MSTESILRVLITAFAVMFIAAIAWWARKHPNRSKQYPEQVRLPKVVPFIGWLFLIFGLLMSLVSFSYAPSPVGAKITAVAIFLGGIAFVLMYRNFYVAPRAHEVAFRTVLGKEHVVPYSGIAEYRVRVMRGQPILTVKSVHGAKLSLNIQTYDVTPLMMAIDFHRATGHWPARTDVVGDAVGPEKHPSGN